MLSQYASVKIAQENTPCHAPTMCSPSVAAQKTRYIMVQGRFERDTIFLCFSGFFYLFFLFLIS